MAIWVIERWCPIREKWEPTKLFDEDRALIEEMLETYTNPQTKKRRRMAKYLRAEVAYFQGKVKELEE